MTTYFLTLAGLLFLYMNGWFVYAVIKKRNDVADVAWGLGFVLLAWASLLMQRAVQFLPLLVVALVTVWGVRLAWHIHVRNRGRAEDPRYQAWRTAWGKWFYLRSYLQVFILQGVLLYLVVFPVLVINYVSLQETSALSWVGVMIWVVGFLFESIGDRQLAAFIRNPANKGKLLMSGLWAYTRHPNYFGEVTQWWGIWLVAFGAPTLGTIAVIGPLTITILILFVSGVPMLEQKMQQHPDFPEYRRRVSMFFPLPPKS